MDAESQVGFARPQLTQSKPPAIPGELSTLQVSPRGPSQRDSQGNGPQMTQDSARGSLHRVPPVARGRRSARAPCPPPAPPLVPPPLPGDGRSRLPSRFSAQAQSALPPRLPSQCALSGAGSIRCCPPRLRSWEGDGAALPCDSASERRRARAVAAAGPAGEWRRREGEAPAV